MHARLLKSLACLVCALTLIGALARGASAVQATPSAAELERAATLDLRAERQERAGRLGEAQATWIELASLLAPGAARDAAGDRARSVELRLQLRREVAEACSLRRDAMREAGLVSANEKELQTTAAVVPWLEVDFMLLEALVKVAKVSTPARLGLVHERIARQTPKDVRAALADLGLLVERGVVPAAEAWSLVARTRGEPQPERGYRFEGGRWVRVDDAEVLERAAGLAEQVEALRKAKPKGRDAAFDALLAFGEDGKAAAMVGLRARCEAAVDELGKRGTLAQLARLADEARDLAERRQAALALIFDEDRYFYPYNPPECPPDRAKLYAGVQREVMRLVEAVRELWNRNPVVKLPAEFRAALDEVRWARRRAGLNGVELGAGVSLPSWLEWLDLELPSVDLQGFALAKAQRDDIARSRAVLRLNAERAARYLKDPKAGKYDDPASQLSVEERDQVAITNEYRVMLGRRALAFDPRLQSAAQGHSDWMSKVGVLSHDEDDPTRRTVAQRLRLAGYGEGGAGENCSMGRPGAEDTHVGWMWSSGHHRNLLAPGHAEMGSALSGAYWTQNFGAGRDHERELAP
ncbi:MAG: CAP domain-containing protein [Planctomycetia bacterium]